MRLSEGEFLAWRAVSSVLEVEEPAEFALLDEIVESQLSNTQRIGRQPGAFDAADIPLAATALYAIAAPVVLAAFPKLFDAALDIGKDVLKKAFERRLSGKSGDSKAYQLQMSVQQVREAILVAGAKRNLSARTVSSLSDALILELLAAQSTGNQNGKA